MQKYVCFGCFPTPVLDTACDGFLVDFAYQHGSKNRPESTKIDTNQQEERAQNFGPGTSGGNSLQKELETHLTKSLLQARNTSNIGFLNQRDENQVEAKRNNSEDKVLLKMAANLLQSSESKAGTDHLTGQVIEKYKVWNLDWQLVNVNFNVNSANL